MENYLEYRKRQLVANVRKERQKRHISQEQLARMIGSSRPRIAHIEAGHGGYGVAELDIIARNMGMDIMDLAIMSQIELDMLTRYTKTKWEIPWLAEETSVTVLNYIYRHILHALPVLDGTLAYSIIHPDNFLADHVIQSFEKKGEMLKTVNLEENRLKDIRAFLRFLLGPNYRKNQPIENMKAMLQLDKDKYMVVIDHAEKIPPQILGWIFNESKPRHKDSDMPKNNYWLIARDKNKFSDALYKANIFPLGYADQKVIYISL